MRSLMAMATRMLHMLDPERAHAVTIDLLRTGLAPKACCDKDPRLALDVFGIAFSNPIGLAAGFDKNAEVCDAVLGQGFGFVEAGTVTPKPQAGNDKPRIFRLSEDRAVINRLGFNNKGLDYFKRKLKVRRQRKGIVGANVGANKDAPDRTADYVTGVAALYGLAAYFTVNISSPNTPGLRALQSKDALLDLVTRVLEVRQNKIDAGLDYVPILVKIAPDITGDDISDIADVTLQSGLDGLIISNTTITRPDHLSSPHKSQMGGLSGAPLMKLSTDTLSRVYQATQGQVPLIGVGGVASGADAYAKIRAGASLVQLYSSLIYSGTGLVDDIKKDLSNLLENDGFENIKDAVGADHVS